MFAGTILSPSFFSAVLPFGGIKKNCFSVLTLSLRRKLRRGNGNTKAVCFFLVPRTGLEPVRIAHTPLKRTRLPVPPPGLVGNLIIAKYLVPVKIYELNVRQVNQAHLVGRI